MIPVQLPSPKVVGSTFLSVTLAKRCFCYTKHANSQLVLWVITPNNSQLFSTPAKWLKLQLPSCLPPQSRAIQMPICSNKETPVLLGVSRAGTCLCGRFMILRDKSLGNQIATITLTNIFPQLHHLLHFHAAHPYAALPAVGVTPDHGTAPSVTGLSRFILGIISYQPLTFPPGLALSSSAPEQRSTARHNWGRYRSPVAAILQCSPLHHYHPTFPPLIPLSSSVSYH